MHPSPSARALTAALGSGLCLLIALVSVPAAASPSPSDGPPWTVKDVLDRKRASGFDISPDGARAVWVKSGADWDKDRLDSDIYLSGLRDSLEVRLTRGSSIDSSPAWSPDGAFIAFLSDRGQKETGQVWLLNMLGGEPRQLTELKQGIESFAWRDNRTIIFAAREDSTLRELQFNRRKDDSRVVGDQEHYVPVRLFSLDINDGAVGRLSLNQGRIIEFAVSPDGRWLVSNENRSVHYEYDFKVPPAQFLYDLRDGGRREIFTAPRVDPFGYVWDLESRGFYCSRAVASDSADTYVSVNALFYYDLGRDKLQRVPLDWPRMLGDNYLAVAGGVIVSLADGVHNRPALFRKDRDNWKRSWLRDQGAANIRLLDIGPDGRSLVFSRSAASLPDRYFGARLSGDRIADPTEMLTLDQPWKNKPIARAAVVRWIGARGDSVEGIIYYPHQLRTGEKHPLVAMIHGGPAGADRDRFDESWAKYPNIMASRGAFVLVVNYHGSSDYGLDWVESIKDRYYEYETEDILDGIDYLIDREPIDPDRLGIMGWSNGSILSIQACLSSDRFKVLGAGAGDVNWTSDYGNCRFGAAFDNAYFGGPPWEAPQRYLDLSPLFRLKKIKTPTIIFFGDRDTSVPAEQGWQHYRALQQIDTVPVRFILFPGEEHSLRKLSHQRRKMEEELAWFDKYLFKREPPLELLAEKNSPLDLLLKKRDLKSVDGLYGESIAGALVPETVTVGSLAIGRLEVTRAQFHAFDGSCAYAEGSGNLPVSDVPFNRVEAYCDWLSSTTGLAFRPPAQAEMASLLSGAKEGKSRENNLNYWLGYDPTPDEILRLQTELGRLQNSLLMEVGSMPPLEDSGLYDLDGNAAEWCAGADGRGVVAGASAVSPGDPKSPYSPPPTQYVGFRVVRTIQ